MTYLFVCLGNICRSPLAEEIFRQRANELGLNHRFDSCGIGAWHSGESPDPRAISRGKAAGYDVSNQRARALKSNDFEKADVIYAMDSDVLKSLRQQAPPQTAHKLALVTTAAGLGGDVADPYYSADSAFDEVIALLEKCAKNIFSS